MKKVKNKKVRLNGNKWGGIPLSMELFQRYGDITDIKNAVLNNLLGDVAGTKYELEGIIKKFQKEKDSTINHIKNFFGPALIDASNNLLYNNNDSEYFYVSFEDYTNYLINLLNNCERYLIDLHHLVILENVKNKAICIVNCYIELKSASSKLLYALGQAEMDLETLEEMQYDRAEEKEDIQRYLELISYAKSDMDFYQIYNFYKDFYNDICKVGDYIFVYLDKYENIWKMN